MWGWLPWSTKKISRVYVHQGPKEYAVTFNSDDYVDGKIPVSTLRNKLEDILNVEQGAKVELVLRDPRVKIVNDQAFLSDYQVTDGSHLLASVRHERAAPLTPRQQLDNILNSVESELGDRIDKFINDPPKDAKVREKEYRILTEVILQNILKLDNIEVEGDSELRQDRKKAINKFHTQHESIDRAFEGKPVKAEAVKAEGVKAESPEGKTKKKSKRSKKSKTQAQQVQAQAQVQPEPHTPPQKDGWETVTKRTPKNKH